MRKEMQQELRQELRQELQKEMTKRNALQAKQLLHDLIVHKDHEKDYSQHLQGEQRVQVVQDQKFLQQLLLVEKKTRFQDQVKAKASAAFHHDKLSSRNVETSFIIVG